MYLLTLYRTLILDSGRKSTELIITCGHRSNDRSITTSDCPLVVAKGQVWPVTNVLVEMSFFAAIQRRLSDKLRRQLLKNGKKRTKASTRRYRGCDVTSMPKEPTWFLSIALYVRNTKAAYTRSKTLEKTGSRVRQTRGRAI